MSSFVLLIIFMVVTPIIASVFPIELRERPTTTESPRREGCVISVTSTKVSLRIRQSGRGPAEVTRFVEEERRKHPEKVGLRQRRQRTSSARFAK